MTLHVYEKQKRDMTVRNVVLLAGATAGVVGLFTSSGWIAGAGLVLVGAGCLLFVREVRLVRRAMHLPPTAGGVPGSRRCDACGASCSPPGRRHLAGGSPRAFRADRVPRSNQRRDWAKADVPQYVHIGHADGDWWVAVADELFASLDLDQDPEGDPACRVFESDPRVIEVWHSDREVYTIEARDDMVLDAFAALAVKGLVAHHLEARARLLDR